MIEMPEAEFRRHVVDRFNAQDAAIGENTALTKQVADDTRFIRETWKEGVTAVRFFCRLAEAWRFFVRSMMLPVGLPALGVWVLIYYAMYGTVPSWLGAVLKLLSKIFL